MAQLSASHTTAELQTISQASQDKAPAVLQGHSTPPFEIKVTDVKVFCHGNNSQWLFLIMLHLPVYLQTTGWQRFSGPKRC